jgi:TetR/AcrR family transcriptional repressor of nem operon
MRRSQEDTAETRARIVAAASHLLRARGIDATSVADVMSAVGLTVGGFYRHFDSKEALVTEAIESASRETAARHLPSADSDLAALLETYLSDTHRKQPGHGCPVAALCSEAGHGSKATRKAFTAALERLLGSIDAVLEPRARGNRKDSLFAASAAVGALVLARATHDEALAGELLTAVRERLCAESARGDRDGRGSRGRG